MTQKNEKINHEQAMARLKSVKEKADAVKEQLLNLENDKELTDEEKFGKVVSLIESLRDFDPNQGESSE